MYSKMQGLAGMGGKGLRSEEHTSELHSPQNLVCRLLLEKNHIRWPHRPGTAACRFRRRPRPRGSERRESVCRGETQPADSLRTAALRGVHTVFLKGGAPPSFSSLPDPTPLET